MTAVRTTDLTPGQRVVVPGSGGLVRTVAEVGATGFLAADGQPIYAVAYAEGRTPGWGSGNSAVPTDEWEVAP